MSDTLNKVAQTISRDLETNLAKVSEQNRASERQTETTIADSANGLIWTQVATLTLISVAILTTLCLFFVLRIIHPINRLKTTLEDIAAGEGNLTQRLPEKGKDEINQVAVAFNLFVNKIHDTLVKTSDATNQPRKVNDLVFGLIDLKAISLSDKGQDR